MERMISIGAVAESPEMLLAWNGLQDYLKSEGQEIDFVLFSSYERQVDSLLRGHVDIAWNTPLAHLSVQRRTKGGSISLCMRDSDRNVRSLMVVRRDAKIRSLSDLSGKSLAVGGLDSAQTRILPLYFLRCAGLDLRTVEILSFVNRAGNQPEAETRESSLLAALQEGKAQAGIISEISWRREPAADRVDREIFKVIWTSPPFDNCVFDAIPPLWPENRREYRSALEGFCRTLYEMDWREPQQRQILKQLRLRRWMSSREEGYDSLRAALKEQEAN